MGKSRRCSRKKRKEEKEGGKKKKGTGLMFLPIISPDLQPEIANRQRPRKRRGRVQRTFTNTYLTRTKAQKGKRGNLKMT